MKTKLGVMLAAVLALPVIVHGDAIDDFVKDHLQRNEIAGMSIAICRDGRVEKAAGYGLANIELDVAASPATVYQTGSVGKQFTSMAVMMLVDAGKVGLDDHISRYFADAPEAWRDITVRHLLTHTSGIKDWEGKTDIDYRRDYSEAELVQVAMKLPLGFAPGTQWSYSNTGYVLLGILVHKVSGQFYGDYLAEHVFRPLGMESTRVISESDIVRNRAAGYVRAGGQRQNQEWVSPSLNTTADGSIYSTVLDLAKWDRALGERRFLQASSYDAMWSPVRLRDGTTYPYGFAWSLDVQRGARVVKHGGSWQGFRSAIARYPERKLTVIVLSNDAEAEPERVATALAGLAEPDLAWPAMNAVVADPEPARTALHFALLKAWAQGEATVTMAPGLRGAIPGSADDGPVREQLQRQLATTTGFRFLAEDAVRSQALQLRGEDVGRIVYYALVGEPAYRARIFLNDQGEVADFAIELAD